VPLPFLDRKPGRSLGTGGKSLFCATFVRNACSREFDELREEDRVAIWILHQSDGPSERCSKCSGPHVWGERNAYQTSPAGGPAALLDLVAIAAHLH
jgi:hypothetical protein